MNGEYVALATRMRAELGDLERALLRAAAAREKALTTGDDLYWDSAALSLQSFYSGVERILVDVARTVEGSVPRGGEWHAALLTQLAAPIPNVRPPVLHTARPCLEDYRDFRHVVRNIYGFEIRPARLRELVEALPACHQALTTDLTRFADFLDSIAR